MAGTESGTVALLAVLGLIPRLFHLTAELGEVHSWRQADTAMIARNFFRYGFDILYPQVNWAGPTPGTVGTEFPLVPFLAALLHATFGERFFYGRLISLLFFIPTVGLFYLLVRRHFGRRAALFALFFYLFSPLSIYYSRTFMSESAMMFFSLAGVLFFVRWVDLGTAGSYLASLACTALSLLVKVPTAIVGLPMGYLVWRRFGWSALRRPSVMIFAAVAVVPSVLWYTHALALARTYYPFHMFGERSWLWDSGLAFLLRIDIWRSILLQATASVVTPVGLALAVWGVMVALRRREGAVLLWWGVGLVLFLLLGMPGHRHEYYQLPFVPVAAAFAGLGCGTLWARWEPASGRHWGWRGGLIVALGSVVAISLATVSLRYYSELTHLLYAAGKTVDRTLPRDAVIVAADWKNPVLIYASDRNGWHFPGYKTFHRGESQWTPASLEELRQQGAQYFVAPVKPPPAPRRLPFLRSLARSLTDRRPEFDYLDSYPDFKAYLETRYRRVLEDGVVTIYDVRGERTE